MTIQSLFVILLAHSDKKVFLGFMRYLNKFLKSCLLATSLVVLSTVGLAKTPRQDEAHLFLTIDNESPARVTYTVTTPVNEQVLDYGGTGVIPYRTIDTLEVTTKDQNTNVVTAHLKVKNAETGAVLWDGDILQNRKTHTTNYAVLASESWHIVQQASSTRGFNLRIN